MPQLERDSKRAILAALGPRKDWLLLPYPTGLAMHPDTGEPVRYGLPGASDYVACRSHVITAADVGRTVGLFVAIEFKSPTGRQRPEQKRFEEAVKARGGIYVLARKIEDVI